MRKIFVFSILGLLSIALFGCSPKYIQNKQYDKTVEITNYYRCTHPDLLVPNESNYDYINENAMFIFVAKIESVYDRYTEEEPGRSSLLNLVDIKMIKGDISKTEISVYFTDDHGFHFPSRYFEIGEYYLFIPSWSSDGSLHIMYNYQLIKNFDSTKSLNDQKEVVKAIYLPFLKEGN